MATLTPRERDKLIKQLWSGKHRDFRSAEDKEITTRLQRGAEMLGLQLLDHVVLGSSGQFASFRELGWL